MKITSIIVGLMAGVSAEENLQDIFMAGKSDPRLSMYDGHHVLRVSPKDTNTTKAFLDELEKLQLGGANLDVWKVGGKGVDVRVSVEEKSRISAMGHPFTILNDDVGRDARESYRWFDKKHNSTKKAEFFDNFQNLDNLLNYYKTLKSKFPSLVTEVASIGKSHEGRDIPAFHLKGNNYKGHKKFYWEGQIHAREWVSGMTVAYLATQLLDGYASDPSVLDDIEFVIVPVVNPDGFAYTWSDQRLWRKNRRAAPRGNPSCLGVDLNRNW
jgi:murein tripeptide amidase MpaA